MSDHLPECKALDTMPTGTRLFYSTSRKWFWEHGCICDRLRACKQRVLDAARERIMRLPYEIDDEILIDRDEVLAWIDHLREGND